MGRNMQDMMPMPRSYHHSQSSRQYGYRRHHTSTFGNQPQRYPHWVGALPDHMWIYPRWYKIPTTQVDGMEKKYQVTPKATSGKIGAPIGWAPQLSESDSS